MKPETIYQGGFWLLGFTVAFFAFVARDRRMPSVADTIYTAILVVFFAAFLAIASGATSEASPIVALWLLRAAAGVLAIGVLLVFVRIWRVHHRHINFRHDKLFQHIGIWRYFAERNRERRYRKEKPEYKHNTTGLAKPLVDSILQCPYVDSSQLQRAVERYKDTDLSLSIGCKASSLVAADDLLLDLSIRFLDQPNCTVQYTSCARHPYEFLLQLKKRWESENRPQTWKQVVSRIVGVDAYTTHFGFTDSIHAVYLHRAKLDGVTIVPSPPTFAGVHTGAMIAFKLIQKAVKLEVRESTLVIYDSPYALVDLESAEQYRIFLRHVLPSERLWGGMLTLFVEANPPLEASDTLRAYVDLFMDLDRPPRSTPAGDVTQEVRR